MLRIIVLAAFATAAGAQTYRSEIYGHAGWGSTWDDEGSIGDGPSAAVNVSRRLTRKIAVEGDFGYFRHVREFPLATVKGSAATLTGNFVYHFTKGRVQPYVLVGAGMMIYNPDPRLDSDSATGWAWGFGTGIKGYITERISIRPEWRVAVGQPSRSSGGPEPPISHSRITVGLGYRW
jgi:hypothetical protein